MINDCVSVLQGGVLDLLLVLPDHGQELPVRVSRIDVFQRHLFFHDLGLLGASLFAILLQTFNFFHGVWSATPLKKNDLNYWIKERRVFLNNKSPPFIYSLKKTIRWNHSNDLQFFKYVTLAVWTIDKNISCYFPLSICI